MTSGKSLDGKPYARNPHRRSYEGKFASAAMARCRPFKLFFTGMVAAFLLVGKTIAADYSLEFGASSEGLSFNLPVHTSAGSSSVWGERFFISSVPDWVEDFKVYAYWASNVSLPDVAHYEWKSLLKDDNGNRILGNSLPAYEAHGIPIEIIVVCSENTTGKTRTATLTIDERHDQLSITQLAEDKYQLLSLPKDNFGYYAANVGATGGDVTIVIKNNTKDSFYASIYDFYPNNESPFLTLKSGTAQFQAMGENTIVYSASALPSGVSSRTGYIQIAHGAMDFEISVLQTSSSLSSVLSLSISGSSSVASGGNTTYTCSATMSDGTVKAVSPDWTITSGSSYASIDSSGKLTANNVSSTQTVTIKAIYGGKSQTKDVTIASTPIDGPILTIVGGTDLSKVDLNGYTDVVVPSSVKRIYEYVFYNKTTLQSISLPEGLGRIDERAFWGCSNLQSLELPSTVTNILFGAFAGCSSIKRLVIPGSLSRSLSGSEGNTFTECTGLVDLTIENGVSFICDSMFYGCSALTNVVIPRSVTQIGSRAFGKCTSLRNVYVPTGLSTVDAFTDCSTFLNIIYYKDALIRLEANGGDADELYVPCEYGVALGALPTPIKAGFVFGGWYSNAALTDVVTSTTKGSASLTKLYAKWNKDVTIGEAIDCTSLDFTTGGSANWFVSGATYYTSGHSVQSGSISHGNSSWMCTTVTGPCAISFYWKVGSERGCDKLAFYIDETSQDNISGTVDWTRKEYTISSAGTHTLKWTYSKDGSVSTSPDCGWVDKLEVSLLAVTDKVMVSFNSNGGSSCSSREYTVGNTYGSLPEPTKSGYTFAGWYSDPSLTTRVYTSTTVSSSVTKLYAKWNSNSTSPIFTIEGGVLKSVDLNGCTEVVIPNNVTSIGYEAFAYCSGLTSVTIPNSVTNIGNDAFYGRSRLTSVTIGNGVTSIGSGAFAYCRGLTSVTIPNSVTSIGEGAFSGCSGLTSVTIPDSVTDIRENAFSGCSGLTSVTIPNSVTNIGGGAFSGCSGLTSVTIPDGVTSIGVSTFYDCSGLTSVTIPNSVKSIEECAFRDCSGLTNVTIGNSVTNIEDRAFCDCSGLTDLTIPNSVASIGDAAFSGCSGLTDLTIPNSVTSIGEGAFSGCSGLTSVTIPNSVTSIGGGAFEFCSGLTSVTIPNSVTSIGRWAFAYCSGLTSVTIGSGVVSIGEVFSYCRDLSSVTIPDGVTSIEMGAFHACDGLTRVTIPNSVTNINWISCSIVYVSDIYDGPMSWSGTTVTGLSLSLSGEHVLSSSTKLSATCAIPGAEMRYTTDGTMPTMESPIFKPFTVKSAMTVTVGAFVDGVRTLTTQGKYWFGEVATPEIAVEGNLTFTGNQARRVSLSCGAEDAVIHYTLSGGEPTEASPVYTGPFDINLAAGETVTIRARAFKANCKPSEISETSITREWTLGDGVNAPSLAFTTGGDAEWVRDTSTGHGDGESLRSGAISDEQATWLETKVNGKGTISFWWKTSCEETDDEDSPWDRVEFSVDGVRVAWLDGEQTEWENIEWSTAEAGEHVLRWGYVKDESGTNGLDCAWVDDIKWTPFSTCKVTFGKNGGTGGDNYVTATCGQPMPTPRTAPKKDGYVFDGYWDTVKEGGKQYYDGNMKSVRNWDKNVPTTLWAKWTPARYKVTFGKNGGTGGDDYVTATYGQAMPTPRTAPKKSGYIFEGYWDTTKDGGRQYYDGSMKSVRSWDKTAAVTLWAKWRKAAVVKATFGKNGGSGGDNYVTCTEGQPMPTPRTAPTRTGWTFAGYWDTLAQDANGNPTGKQYYDASMKSVRNFDKSAEATLWAKWTVRVKLGKNGGTGGDDYVTVTYNQPFPKRTMPKRSGYVFGGYWVSASSKTGQCYNPDGTGTSTMKWTTGGTPTVWALWTKTSSCVEVAPADFAAPGASAAPVAAESAAIPAGLYSGVIADGSGAFWLMLDEPEEGCDRTAYLYVASEDGGFTAECTAEEAGGVLLLETEDGVVYAFDPIVGTLAGIPFSFER